MIVTITLDSNIGADLGPFNLTANVGAVAPSTATRAQLIAGLDVTVDDSATTLTITSTGACTDSITRNISGIPVEEGVPISWVHQSNNATSDGTSRLTITYTPAGTTTTITLTDETPVGATTYTNGGSISAKVGTDVVVQIQNFGPCPTSTFLELSPQASESVTEPTSSLGGTYSNVQLGTTREISALTELAAGPCGGGSGGSGGTPIIP